MGKKISGMTAGAVADFGATTTGFEVAADLTTVPRTLRATFGALATWLFSRGTPAPTTIAFADSPYAVAADDTVLLTSTAGGAVQVTLPAAPAAGRTVIVKRKTTDANAITVARNGKNIEGAAANLSIPGGTTASVTLQYDATTASWWIL